MHDIHFILSVVLKILNIRRRGAIGSVESLYSQKTSFDKRGRDWDTLPLLFPPLLVRHFRCFSSAVVNSMHYYVCF